MSDTPPAVVVVEIGGAVAVVDLTDDLEVVNVTTNPTIQVVDMTLTGGESTVIGFVYTDEVDARPDVSMVFWIPDPYTLGDPFGAVEGDVVLRSTPDVVAGINGITGVWRGTSAEYEALTPDPDVLYYVIAPDL
jgi:hypothetical protein